MAPTNRKRKTPQKATPLGSRTPFAPPGYEQHQGEIALRMNHFLMRYLKAIYQEFDGDLALVIVLGEIAHHNVTRLYSFQGPLPPSGSTNSDAPDLYAQLEPCNAFSLAAATGIPRETVRRKMEQLVKRGWLEIRADGARMLPAVGKHFRPDFNVRLLRELLETSGEITKVLTSDQPTRFPPPKP